jgi:hypothetical protein
MDKKKASGLVITELMLVKPGDDFTRTFIGEIRRETDGDGRRVLTCEVVINDGTAWSRSTSEEELRKNMDEICKMKLDCKLHSDAGITVRVFGEVFFLN